MHQIKKNLFSKSYWP